MGKMRLLAFGITAALLVATAVAASASTSPVDQARDALRQRVLRALANVDGAGSTPAAGRQTRELGNLALEQTTADVWVHGEYAYAGSWAGTAIVLWCLLVVTFGGTTWRARAAEGSASS